MLKNTLILILILKNYPLLGDGYGADIPEPVEDEDENQFLIPIEYGQGNG